MDLGRALQAAQRIHILWAPSLMPLYHAVVSLVTWRRMAVGQNQWYHFGVGAPPILEPFSVGIGMFTGGTGF